MVTDTDKDVWGLSQRKKLVVHPSAASLGVVYEPPALLTPKAVISSVYQTCKDRLTHKHVLLNFRLESQNVPYLVFGNHIKQFGAIFPHASYLLSSANNDTKDG